MKKLLLAALPVLAIWTFYTYASEQKVNCTDIPKTEWTKEIEWCWSNTTYDFQKALFDIWYDRDLANYLINMCKLTANKPHHCVVLWGSIGLAESWAWKAKNVMWVLPCKWVSSRWEWVSCWGYYYNERNNWWRYATHINQFYSPCWSAPKTHYCMSEHSSWCSLWCPNWLRHSSHWFERLMQVVNKHGMDF